MPVYNGELLLARTLEALLGQTYPHLEVIVCDNASTDDTENICRRFAARDRRIRYERNEVNRGAIPNFRRTLEIATGEYFAWTAADDVRPNTAIEQCVRALERDTSAVMAHGPVLLDMPHEGISRHVGNCMQLHCGTAAERVRAFTTGLQHVGMLFGVYRREELVVVGFGSHIAGDYFVCLQMCQRGPVAWVPDPILIYRHRYGSVSSPMYERAPITLRDLLLHRGVRRRKCWMALGIGCYYLWRQGVRDGLAERLRTVGGFARAFVVRFRPELATESVFLLFSPVAWVAAPLAPVGRRLRRALRTTGAAHSR